SKGLSPVSVDEQGNGKAGKSFGGGGGSSSAAGGEQNLTPPEFTKVSKAALESFTREMANLLAAGLPLSRALSLLKREASQAAMVYPMVLVCMAVGVLIFLLTFFIPRFEGIFKEFGEGLPALTKVIVAVSKVVGSKKGFAVLGGLVLGGIGLKRWFETEAGK